MTIAVLCVGDELLDGRISDTNTRTIAQHLRRGGHTLASASVCPDDPQVMARHILAMASTHATVLMTGGLGPTQDDITREVLAQAAGVKLVFKAEAWEVMQARFEARGLALTQNNRRQCLFPKGSTLLPNDAGSAMGFRVQIADATFFCMPGVPSECAWMMQHVVMGALSGQTPEHVEQFHVFGMAESHVEHALEGIEALALEQRARVAYCAGSHIIEITITARSAEALAPLRAMIQGALGAQIVGDHEGDLRARLAGALTQAGHTVSTAESCTGGAIAAALTDRAGSSAWFERGWVTYANEAKMDMVGVHEVMLEHFGAVSPQVVLQMAAGAQARAGSTYALAVSGIAGPGGGSDDKPVGTVHLALASPQGCWHMQRLFAGLSRAAVRSRTVETALAMLWWSIEGTLEHREDVSGPLPAREILRGE